jgi:hypothetical protein
MSESALSAALRAAFLARPLCGAVDNTGLTAHCDAMASAFWPYLEMVADGGIYITPEGGLARQLTNKTGAATVKGTLVFPSSTVDNAFETSTAQYDGIGFVYESGIADGSAAWVVFSGVAEALFEDGNAPVRDYWVRASTTAGRVYCEAAPSGGGFINASEHFKEVGHCQESKSSGTDVLARVAVHFL